MNGLIQDKVKKIWDKYSTEVINEEILEYYSDMFVFGDMVIQQIIDKGIKSGDINHDDEDDMDEYIKEIHGSEILSHFEGEEDDDDEDENDDDDDED